MFSFGLGAQRNLKVHRCVCEHPHQCDVCEHRCIYIHQHGYVQRKYIQIEAYTNHNNFYQGSTSCNSNPCGDRTISFLSIALQLLHCDFHKICEPAKLERTTGAHMSEPIPLSPTTNFGRFWLVQQWKIHGQCTCLHLRCIWWKLQEQKFNYCFIMTKSKENKRFWNNPSNFLIFFPKSSVHFLTSSVWSLSVHIFPAMSSLGCFSKAIWT